MQTGIQFNASGPYPKNFYQEAHWYLQPQQYQNKKDAILTKYKGGSLGLVVRNSMLCISGPLFP